MGYGYHRRAFMEYVHQRLAALGTAVPEIILPRPGVDLEKWAVIACDQFTQNRAYWEKVRDTAGCAPSALNMIFPELYLGGEDRKERIRNIHAAMKGFLEGGIFAPPRRSCVYLERSTPFHSCRRGLVLAVDLERYDWTPGSRRLIRATEGTVPERLPPRVEIRRDAPLEIPHILLLIDDEADTLLPGLGARVRNKMPAYDTPLMMNSGAVRGWFLEEEAHWEFLAQGLEALAGRARTRYGREEAEPFLFAVGDGNHSLATAKVVWEDYKAAHQEEGGLPDHPARWALVEVENLYDPGISFEPIHRLLLGASAAEVLGALKSLPGFSCRTLAAGTRPQFSGDAGGGLSRLGIISGKDRFLVEYSAPGLATNSLQPLLDALILNRAPGVSIDYIHGEDELFNIAGTSSQAAPAVGILLPGIEKRGLFETVARSGPLPRKSFSMGEAEEKRFYLEGRRLFSERGP
jgi:hypothetical protein